MAGLRFGKRGMILREIGDDLQADVLRQAGLFAVLLSALAIALLVCFRVFWVPALLGFLP